MGDQPGQIPARNAGSKVMFDDQVAGYSATYVVINGILHLSIKTRNNAWPTIYFDVDGDGTTTYNRDRAYSSTFSNYRFSICVSYLQADMTKAPCNNAPSVATLTHTTNQFDFVIPLTEVCRAPYREVHLIFSFIQGNRRTLYPERNGLLNFIRAYAIDN